MHGKNQIAALFADEPINTEVVVKGWVKTFRNNQFISLNDGSCQKSIQIVVDRDNTAEDLLRKINPGAALIVKGKVIESMGKGQTIEIVAESVEVVGESKS